MRWDRGIFNGSFVGHGQSAFLRGKWAMVHSYWKATKLRCPLWHKCEETIDICSLFFSLNKPSLGGWKRRSGLWRNGDLDACLQVGPGRRFCAVRKRGWVGEHSPWLSLMKPPSCRTWDSILYSILQYPFWWGTVVTHGKPNNKPSPSHLFTGNRWCGLSEPVKICGIGFTGLYLQCPSIDRYLNSQFFFRFNTQGFFRGALPTPLHLHTFAIF